MSDKKTAGDGLDEERDGLRIDPSICNDLSPDSSSIAGEHPVNSTLFTPSSTSYPYVDSEPESDFAEQRPGTTTPRSETSKSYISDLPPSYEQAQAQAQAHSVPHTHPRDPETQSLPPYIRSPESSDLELHRLDISDDAPVANGLSPLSPNFLLSPSSGLLDVALEFAQRQPTEDDLRFAPALSRWTVIPQMDSRRSARAARTRVRDRPRLGPLHSASWACPSHQQSSQLGVEGRRRGPPWTSRSCHDSRRSQSSLSSQAEPEPVDAPQFARAYSKALHAHSISSAEFAAFIDSFNALLLACDDGDAYDCLTGTPPDREASNVAAVFLKRVNEEFFAPRRLRVRVAGFEELLDLLDVSEEQRTRLGIDSNLLSILGGVKNKSTTDAANEFPKAIAEILDLWTEPLTFDLPQPGPQIERLRAMLGGPRQPRARKRLQRLNEPALSMRKGSIASLNTISTASSSSTTSTSSTDTATCSTAQTTPTPSLNTEAALTHNEAYLATLRNIETTFARQTAKGKIPHCAIERTRECALAKAAKELARAQARIERVRCRAEAKAARQAGAQELRTMAQAWTQVITGRRESSVQAAREAFRAEKRAMALGWQAASLAVTGSSLGVAASGMGVAASSMGVAAGSRFDGAEVGLGRRQAGFCVEKHQRRRDRAGCGGNAEMFELKESGHGREALDERECTAPGMLAPGSLLFIVVDNLPG